MGPLDKVPKGREDHREWSPNCLGTSLDRDTEPS